MGKLTIGIYFATKYDRMNKFFNYIIIFTVASILNPLIRLIFLSLKELGISTANITLLSLITSWLLLLTFGQLLIILNESKPIEYVETSTDEVPSLDWGVLNQYTYDIESLGFHKLIDYKPSNLSRSGLARLFSHPKYHCFIEVYQISGLPTTCVVKSLFINEWSLANVNRQFRGLLGGLMYMRRLNRSLCIAQPGVSPSELLDNHLARRTKMMRDLEIDISTDISIDAYFNYERSQAKKRLQIIKSKWIAILLIEAIVYALHPKSEWMGEYNCLSS